MFKKIFLGLFCLFVISSCDGTLSIDIAGLWTKSDYDDGVKVDQYLYIDQEGSFCWFYYLDDVYSSDRTLKGSTQIEEESFSVVFEPLADGDQVLEPIIKNFVIKNENHTLYLFETKEGNLVGDRLSYVSNEEKISTLLIEAGGLK